MTATTQTETTPAVTAPDAPETEVVTSWKVCCDGGVGALGHPRVWLSIPHDTGFVECGYCDKKYVIDRAKAGH
ncbi:zinc-finger domain-containing protein [Thioclava sp. GXIMD2076]|uniref:Zinc-finger domain-containing protein n=1 Tax=Thioclava kandeliae TaxID=3070818 RepID=A0ABV1SDL1_9RHOB